MQRVLAVSDDSAFLECLVQANAISRMFQLVTASNTWEALTEQRLRPAVAALIDLHGSTWDAYQFLGEIHKDFPGLPIIGLTQTTEVALERRARQMGIVRIANRAASPEFLLNEVHFALEASPTGFIEGLHLSSLLQVLHWERKNCRARVQVSDQEGILYFDRGLLVHAVCENLSGRDAAMEILGWEEARVEFMPAEATPRTIHQPLDEILMLVAKHRDEAECSNQPLTEAAAPRPHSSWEGSSPA